MNTQLIIPPPANIQRLEPMYRIKLQSGEESEFSSFEELCFGIVSGIIGPDDEIYHAKASKWLPINSHPHYKRAAAQAPPPTPAMASPSSVTPSGVSGSHEPPEDEGGQDLMTLLDLEEITASGPGKLQELAPAPQADPEAETAELEPVEAQEPEALETNGHAAQSGPEADELDEPAADTEDPTECEMAEAAAELDVERESDDTRGAELSDDQQPAEEPATVALDVDKETELDDGEETPVAELTSPEGELVSELKDPDSDTDEAEAEEAESELDEVDGVQADAADGSREIDYVAAEDRNDEPTVASSADPDTAEEIEDDETDVVVLDDLPSTEHADSSQDIVYLTAEDGDDRSMMESVVSDAEVYASDETDVEEAQVDEAADDEEAVEDDEPVAETATQAMLEVEEEVVDEAADLEDSDADEDVGFEAEPVAQGDEDDDDDGDPLLGGPVVELDHSMDEELGDTAPGDELGPEEELVAAAEVVDPIEAFQPDLDDDAFHDIFSPGPELSTARRFPIVPVAIAAGAVVMAVLGWMLMGSSGSDEPVTVPDLPAQAPATAPTIEPAPAAVPRVSAGLTPEPVVENPVEDMQRRYDEAYSQARSRLDADLRRAGFTAVFSPGNFASEDEMITARAAIAGARLAVTAYAGREQGIRDDFPDADPTGREARVHREIAEDLLAVSRRIYDVLLENMEAFAIRTGGMTITDPAVEAEYARLLGEVNRLMALAATADEEQAATVRRVAAAVGATRPPALVELPPPPSLPTDL
jgi:hypothetical protein